MELDGMVTDEEWDRIPSLPMTMFSPAFGEPLTERTEVRIAHDEEYLYVSGRLYDSEPEAIRVNTFYRDQYSGDDLLAVVIDSFNDFETALWFIVNPSGARSDRTVSNDAVGMGGGMPMNADWNAHWDVATRQTDEGWFVEYRIPFSTLGFQAVDGQVTMGLIVYRFIARKNERHLFPAIDPGWGGLAFAKPSQAHRIVLSGAEPQRPVYVTPYSLGGLRQSPERTVAGSGDGVWDTSSHLTGELGADLRFNPSSNLALDFTANTDFAQVEADNQQVNLTRFPLFFPEKRQFFQERSSTFDFSAGGGSSRLFHSRRIGLDDGEIVRIYGGGRAVGRLGGTDFGFLAMQTAARDQRPSETMGVARINHQVLNPFSAVGGMLTTRLGSHGENNVGLGLDATLRLVGDEWLTAKWARTFDEVAEPESAMDAGLVEVRWQRRKDGGLSYRGEYIRVGDNYLPRLGFQARRDFQYVGGQLQYKSYREAASPLRSVSLQVASDHYFQLAGGSPQSRQVAPQFNLEFKGGTQLRLSGNSSFESIGSPFEVAGARVEPGDYWFHDAELRLQRPRSALFRGDFTAVAGSFYDGTRYGAGVNPTWNQSRYLELGGGYEVNRLDFGERGLSTTAHLLRLNVQMALNTRISASVLGQYSNVAELATFNARFRYHFREGTDLWLVFNEGLNVGARLDDLDPHSRLPRSAGRTLLLKYTRTLIW